MISSIKKGAKMLKKIANVIICAFWVHRFEKFERLQLVTDPVRCLRCERLIELLDAKVNGQWV